jgi:hypothetical protein
MLEGKIKDLLEIIINGKITDRGISNAWKAFGS